MSEGNGSRSQVGWLRKELDTHQTIVMAFGRSLKPLIFTSVFYRIIALTVLTPLASGFTGMLLARSGHVVIANEVIAEFLLQPIGLLIMLVIAACGIIGTSMLLCFTSPMPYDRRQTCHAKQE